MGRSGWRLYRPMRRCFHVSADPATPLPAAQPHVVWRLGLDLHPMDVADAADCAWLETLVWPEQSDRLDRLRAAMAVARREPPRVVQGDLLNDLASMRAAGAPGRDACRVPLGGARLCGGPALREQFVRTVRELGAVWISNEVPGVFPSIRERLTAARSARRIPAVGRWCAGRVDRPAWRLDRMDCAEEGQSMKLAGQIALVTGGSRGIGRATALAFAAEGADIAFCHLDDGAKAEETADEIRALGRRAMHRSLDVADIAATRAFARKPPRRSARSTSCSTTPA